MKNNTDIKISQSIKNNSGTVIGVLEGNISTNYVCENNKNEIQVSWLHLSDLHLGKDNYDEAVVIEKLLDDIQEQIKNNNIKLDFVFITGDLTFSGQKEEFKFASEFISKLSSVCQIAKEDIILVPGNHDVTRDNISDRTKKMRNNIKKGKIYLELLEMRRN